MPCLSKVFEDLIVDQPNRSLSHAFSSHSCGFRIGHSFQSVLLTFVENCKRNLDRSNVYGAILTDLSKAFDCLRYRLLVSKLQAYGLSRKACLFKQVTSISRDRVMGCVKVVIAPSVWMTVRKGAPQGSILGPFIV